MSWAGKQFVKMSVGLFLLALAFVPTSAKADSPKNNPGPCEIIYPGDATIK